MIRSYINGETPSTSTSAPKPESSKPLPKPLRYKLPNGDGFVNLKEGFEI